MITKSYKLIVLLILIVMGCKKNHQSYSPSDDQNINVVYKRYPDSLHCYTKNEDVQVWRSKDTLTVSGYRKGKEAFHLQVLMDTLDFSRSYTLSNNAEKIKHGAIKGNVFFDPKGWNLDNPVGVLAAPYDEVDFYLMKHDSLLIGHFDGFLLSKDLPAIFAGSFYGKVEYRK